MRSRIGGNHPAPLNGLLTGFTDVLDIRDSEVSVFAPSCFLLLLLLVLLAHFRAGYSYLVPHVLGQIDALAAQTVALSVLARDDFDPKPVCYDFGQVLLIREKLEVSCVECSQLTTPA